MTIVTLDDILRMFVFLGLLLAAIALFRFIRRRYFRFVINQYYRRCGKSRWTSESLKDMRQCVFWVKNVRVTVSFFTFQQWMNEGFMLLPRVHIDRVKWFHKFTDVRIMWLYWMVKIVWLEYSTSDKLEWKSRNADSR